METLFNKWLEIAMAEDLGDGDHTSLSILTTEATGNAKLIAKQTGILAGVDRAIQIFYKYSPLIEFNPILPDGTHVKPGDIAFTVHGPVQKLLAAERVVLNVMQRMSGIATQTHEYCEIIKGTRARILDTRKTTPGMRVLDKESVRIGGGTNHRIGLFDMILIKDNHVDFAGGIVQALEKANRYINEKNMNLDIEIEVRSFEELDQVLNYGNVQRIMLDNFSVENTYKAVKIIAGRYLTESSGGITKTNIRAYAETGVDFISVGALTHQIQSLDLSLKAF